MLPNARPGYAYDALAQTYFWQDGKLYSRYPPGFPALLALAGLVGGEQAQHWLNPLLYLTILTLLGWLTWTLVRPNDRALAAGTAVAAMWLLLVLPTDVHLWGITVARDLPAHLLALLAILAAAGHRLRGLRPRARARVHDPARRSALRRLAGRAVLARRRPACARCCSPALAFLVGATPLFAYNTLTQGHPLAFTQGGEFRDVLGALLTPASAWAQGITHSSGGAFQLANVGRSLPGNLAHLGRSFGWLGLATVLGAVWGVRARRPLAAALVPYPLVAVVFYSCWSHPDARYLAGAALCLLPLTAVGLVVACRWVADERRAAVWRAARRGRRAAGDRAAVAPACGCACPVSASRSARSRRRSPRRRSCRWLPRIGAAARRLAPLAPAVALAAVALAIVLGSAGAREPFQRERIERARAVLGALIPPGSLVITSESLGRPAENIAHYVGADTLYPGEISLLFEKRAAVAMRFLIAGRRVFFLLRSDDRETLAASKRLDPARVVARARGAELYDWFVDPAAAPFGAALYEIEPSPFTLQLREQVARDRAARGAR